VLELVIEGAGTLVMVLLPLVAVENAIIAIISLQMQHVKNPH